MFRIILAALTLASGVAGAVMVTDGFGDVVSGGGAALLTANDPQEAFPDGYRGDNEPSE